MPGVEGVVSRLNSLPVNHVAHVIEVLDDYGVDSAKWLEQCGLDTRWVHAGTEELSSDIYYAFLALVLAHTDIPSFAVRVGRKFSLADYGVLGYACISSQTIGHLLQTFFRYQQLVGSASSFSEALRVQGDTAMIEIQSTRGEEQLSRFDTEEAMGQWCAAAEEFWSGEGVMYSRINLSFRKPSYADDLQALVGCPVAYEQPRNEMLFPLEVLDQPIGMANELTSRLCAQQCAAILEQLTQQQGLVEQVRRLIINQPAEVSTPEDIARQLNISYRTLRRRLGEEGQSFKAIHNEVRMGLAAQYLRQTRLSTQEITFLLGYSEASNFHRAFKAWFGETPGEFRESSSDLRT